MAFRSRFVAQADRLDAVSRPLERCERVTYVVRQRAPHSRWAAWAAWVALGLLLTAPNTLLAQSGNDPLRWRATVYGWLPGISGATKLPATGGGGDIGIDVGEILDALDFVFMGQIEARGNRWGGFADYVYVDFSDSRSRVRSFSISGPAGVTRMPASADLSADMDLDGSALTLAGTYTLIEREGFELLSLGGARRLRVDTNVDWTAAGNIGSLPPLARAGNAAAQPRYTDAIVGVRGRATLGQTGWYLPYYIDAGAGDSDRTWQTVVGIGYRFSVGEVTFVHRRLEYEFAPDSPLVELGFSGFALGFSWRW